MGTQVHCKSYFPGCFSMRDLNEDSNSSNWPLFYGDKALMSGQFYNGYMPRSMPDACAEYDKDTLKQKMLEHEAIFRNQVFELHRLYRTQREMMEDIRRKELCKRQTSIEPSSSSSLRGSQMPSGDARKWHMSSFPVANSCHPGPSISGVDIVTSPLSCTKGGNAYAGTGGGSTSKNCEVLEVRPSKVRKKLFDLQLPAHEYIDTEEGKLFHGSNMNISSSLPNGDKAEKQDKFFLNGCSSERFGRQWDVSTSESCLRSSVGLADLNEPVLVEDGIVPSSIDYLLSAANHKEGEALNYCVKPSSQFLGLRKEIIQNADWRHLTGSLDDVSVSHKEKEKDWLCGMFESGLKKNNLFSIPHGLPQDQLPLPSKPLEVMLNKVHQSPAILPKDHGTADFWRERTNCNLEAPDRIHDSSMTSQTPHQYAYLSYPELDNSWSHSALSWGKPTSSLTEKPSSFHVYQAFSSSSHYSKSSHSSALSHGIFGEKWQSKGCSRLLPGSSGQPITNGFYHGSTSGPKEMLRSYPSIGFSHLGNGTDNDVRGCSVNHEPGVVAKDTNHIDVKPTSDMDLNVVHSNCTSNEAISTQDVEVINEKCKPEGHLASLPWLRPRLSSRSEAVNVRDAASEGFNLFKASPSKLFHTSVSGTGFCKTFDPKGTPSSVACENTSEKEVGDANGFRKILGVPIFDKISTSRKETSSSVSNSVACHHSLPCEELPCEGKKRVIDINLACDEQMASEVLALEEEIETKVTRTRIHIDLNSCISEDADEEPLASSITKETPNKKIGVDIDLEAPAPEIDDDLLPGEQHHEDSLQSLEPKPEQAPEELAQMAAEAIVSFSLSDHPVGTKAKICESSADPLADSLLWFAEVIGASSDTKETEGSKEAKRSKGLQVGIFSPIELDDFEIMTLQLQETKEEDYMPKPFVLDVQKMEETGASTVPNRGRKGQTRRGRQRRDFQRDILPGLASLSRHEVTEDLQTFGGLMKATGHTWSSGLTRRNGTRNGGGRGRRRTVMDKVSTVVANLACTPLIQQLNTIEASLEDRSLTGWGKTTRRPRRQRCPAGNPPTVPLT